MKNNETDGIVGNRMAQGWIGLTTLVVVGLALGGAGSSLAREDTPVRQIEVEVEVEESEASDGAAKEAAADGAGDAITVEAQPLEIETEFEGVFGARSAHEMAARTDEWESLTVERAVEHGKRVREGEVLVRFEKKPLEDEIAGLQAQVETGRRDLATARAELAALEETTPRDVRAAARDLAEAADDLDYYENVSRPLREESVAQGLRSAEFRLENAREELDQLQKMYEADDLTEETEEIILKRARNDVESAEFSLRMQQNSAERTLSTEMKREHRALREALERSEIALAATRVSLPSALEKKRIENEKAAHDLEKSERRLAALRRDIERLKLTAPADGWVYYGRFENGKMASAADAAKKLVPGGKAAQGEVLLTVVESRPLEVHAIVPEDKIAGVLRPGVRGHAFPTANPGAVVPVRVRDISPVPAVGGGLPVRLEIDGDQPDERTGIMPGHACRITLIPVSRERALLVPRGAVRFEQGTAKVRRIGEGDAIEEIEVEVGAVKGDRIEIRKGLAPGDRIRR